MLYKILWCKFTEFFSIITAFKIKNKFFLLLLQSITKLFIS